MGWLPRDYLSTNDTFSAIIVESAFSLLPLCVYLLPWATLNKYRARCRNKNFFFSTSSGILSISRSSNHPTFVLCTVADLHSKFWTRPPPVQILSISCSFGGNLAKSYVAPPWRVGAPLLGEILDPPLYRDSHLGKTQIILQNLLLVSQFLFLHLDLYLFSVAHANRYQPRGSEENCWECIVSR